MLDRVLVFPTKLVAALTKLVLVAASILRVALLVVSTGNGCLLLDDDLFVHVSVLHPVPTRPKLVDGKVNHKDHVGVAVGLASKVLDRAIHKAIKRGVFLIGEHSLVQQHPRRGGHGMGNVVIHHDALRKGRLPVVQLCQLDVEVVVVERHTHPKGRAKIVTLQQGHMDHADDLSHVVQSHAYGFLALVLAVFRGDHQTLFLFLTIAPQLFQDDAVQGLVSMDVVEMRMHCIQGALEHTKRHVTRLQRC